MGTGRRTRVRAIAALLIAATALGACSSGRAPAPSGEGSAPSGDTLLADRLASEATGSDAVLHLQALQAIADRHGGNRASGTPGYDRSVDYVAETLRRAGYDVSIPTMALRSEDEDENDDERATPRTTRNVVAQTRQGRTDEVVLAGAHLDSVPEGPGIDDNGSGVAAQLEVALTLGVDAPVTNAVRFVWFGAEEDGLLGSAAYVDALSSDQRRDIAVMLNSDVIAAPNGGYFVYDGDDSDGTNTEPAAPGSEAIERLLVGRLAALNVPARSTPFIDDSDYGPFVAAGVPTGGVFSGDAETKTPEQAAVWGGRADEQFDPCYHEACDTIANINRPVLDRMLDTLAFGTGAFAMSLDGVPPRAERTAR